MSLKQLSYKYHMGNMTCYVKKEYVNLQNVTLKEITVIVTIPNRRELRDLFVPLEIDIDGYKKFIDIELRRNTYKIDLNMWKNNIDKISFTIKYEQDDRKEFMDQIQNHSYQLEVYIDYIQQDIEQPAKEEKENYYCVFCGEWHNFKFEICQKCGRTEKTVSVIMGVKSE